MDAKVFARRLEDALGSRKMSQTDLARLMKISDRHLSAVKMGKYKVTSRILAKICEALDVPASYFSDDECLNIMSRDIPTKGYHEEGDSLKISFLGKSSMRDTLGKPILQFSPISFKKDYLLGKTEDLSNLRMVRSNDSSMQPTLNDGSLVLIDIGNRTPADGKIFLLNVNGKSKFRRIELAQGKISGLIADNGNLREDFQEKDVEILGRVILAINDIV